ncbi:NRDE family protein [Aggregicoccus sp. 17bor-14]|uniref:NRDE family protein n=1 Tax=Myxococcaceae TaxID=31 RepID=UPI00129C174F|nr:MULTISPECIES: NRDE family protein [Myxococcaceae]MBF5041323.1 NRDE family protein [Simulacricoccus sp. 17bor-14]MRI87109.1 NRDE family protein [Aggregicoccus sp. 17bor-14]
MCTVLVLRRVHPTLPLVLAANRDEFYARPARGPEVLLASPRTIGGRDEVRAGTWMGVTDAGLFVGLTNQRTSGPADATRRSRGEVVLRALESGSVDGVERLLDTLAPAEFNPFNLLYGDAERLRVAYARPEGFTREDVPEGLHVLPNDRLDHAGIPKVTRARALVGDVAGLGWEELCERLKGALADHALPPLESVEEPAQGSRFTRELVRQLQALCIHTPAYGTRSSALVALQPGRVAHYLATEGAPCVSPWVDVLPLVYPRG